MNSNTKSISSSAEGLILLYGKNAEMRANQMVAKFAKRGDQEGEETWRAIALEIHKQEAR